MPDEQEPKHGEQSRPANPVPHSETGKPFPVPQHSETSWSDWLGFDPGSYLKLAIEKVRSARFILVLLGISAWLAISIRFGLSVALTLSAPFLALIFLGIVLIFDAASKETKKKLGRPISVFIWFCVAAFVLGAVSLFSACTFAWPKNLAGLIGVDKGESRIVAEPFGKNRILDLGIHLATEALSRPNLPERASQEQKLVFCMGKWLEWVNEGARPKNLSENLLVLKSRSPSTKRYEPFRAVIEFEDNDRVELTEGCAFIVSKEPGDIIPTIYRQQSFVINASSPTNANQLVIKDLSEGDEILIILKVRSRKKGVLPLDTNQYGIHVHSTTD